jgi:hypothetical protein
MQTHKLELGMRMVAVVLLLAGPIPSGHASAADSTGRVCLAAAPSPGEESPASPGGVLPDVRYAVQIDKLQPIELSRDVGHWVQGLSVSQPHLVVIRSGGKPITSFRFRFTDNDQGDLCLFMSPYYQTWQLWPDKRCPWCKCEGGGVSHGAA